MRKLTDDSPTDDVPAADPRQVRPARVGTPLRDAAVDPHPEDYLAPVNAGQADPHSSDVVSPGIHAGKGKRVTPGKLSAKPAAQEIKEAAQAVQVTQAPAPATQQMPATPPVPDSLMPARNASADEWRAYAISKGMNATEADNAGRDELVKRYAP